jgi:hypothetical protein
VHSTVDGSIDWLERTIGASGLPGIPVLISA